MLELILDVKKRGLPIVLISHNMPHVFEVADRIHIHRLGRRLCVIDPKQYTMSDAVAFMTGAKTAAGGRRWPRRPSERFAATASTKYCAQVREPRRASGWSDMQLARLAAEIVQTHAFSC